MAVTSTRYSLFFHGVFDSLKVATFMLPAPRLTLFCYFLIQIKQAALLAFAILLSFLLFLEPQTDFIKKLLYSATHYMA